MWTLDEALTLIRQIQPNLHVSRWHVALGGGVLNKGQSQKDLDLYFLPFDANVTMITPYLVAMWGTAYPLSKQEDEYPENLHFYSMKFFHGGKRIDVFIARPEAA